MRIEINAEAKTFRIYPQNEQDHTDLSALGFLEGGDFIQLVRQDIPGTSDLDFLDTIVTPEQYQTIRNGAKGMPIPGPQP